MNKIRQQSLTALYPTALIAVVGIFLTMFYWSFNIYIGGATAFLFFSSVGMFFFSIATLVMFYAAWKNKQGYRILNVILALVSFSYTLSGGIHVFNNALFSAQYGDGMVGNFFKGKTVCGHVVGFEEYRTANTFTEENGQHYIQVLCPSLFYKTDKIVVPQKLADLINQQE